MAANEKTSYTNAGEDGGWEGNLTHYWWECKLVQPLSLVFKKTKNGTAI
jgi:hypothetical protein